MRFRGKQLELDILFVHEVRDDSWKLSGRLYVFNLMGKTNKCYRPVLP
jgi:hypothetical protein